VTTEAIHISSDIRSDNIGIRNRTSSKFKFSADPAQTEIARGKQITEIASKKKDIEYGASSVEELYPTNGLTRFVIFSSSQASNILRTSYSLSIIDCLNWLSENHKQGAHTSLNTISKMLNLILEFSNKAPNDVFCGFLLALYDGLVHEDDWVNLDASRFNRIAQIVKALNNQKSDYQKVVKYIHKLHEVGMNVLPY